MSYILELYVKLAYIDGYEIYIATEQCQRYILHFSHFLIIDPFVFARLRQEGQGIGWTEEFWG